VKLPPDSLNKDLVRDSKVSALFDHLEKKRIISLLGIERQSIDYLAGNPLY
jgi:hypothetical protein